MADYSRSMFVEVADRVFQARYPQWDVNVGLVLGRDGAVVIDTRASDSQGLEIIRDIAQLGRDIAVRHVINTHVHFDHTFGNIVFDQAQIVAHRNVARSFVEASEQVKTAFRADPGAAPEYGYTTADAAAVIETPLRAPDRTFRGATSIDLGDREVSLRWSGRGHTDGDIAITVPDAGVTFLGDLIEESAHPSLGNDCWPIDWPTTLSSLDGYLTDDSIVIPGHGRPVDRAFVRRQRDDLAIVAAVIRERHAARMPLASAQREPDARLPYPLDWLQSAFARGYEQLT